MNVRPRNLWRRRVLRLSTMKSRSVLDMPSERFPSQTCACVSARPISSACFFVRSGVASHARRAASSGSPGEKLALRRNPIAELMPAPEDGLMRHFSIGFAAFRGRRDQKTIRMIRKLGHEPPFLIRKLGTQRAPSRRLLALAHCGELQGEYAAKFVVRFRMISEKGYSDQPPIERQFAA